MSSPNAVAPFLRIGWWGTGQGEEICTPFATFSEFAEQISGSASSSTNDMSAAAMGRMEMAARELAKETMLSRTLALENAAFEVISVNVGENHQRMYDRATSFWTKLIKFFDATFATMKAFDFDLGGAVVDQARTKKSMRVLTMQMWGAHQKFFKSLMVSTKIPYLIQRAKDLNASGKAVVLAMWSTGGNAIDSAEKDSVEIVSAPRESILKLLGHLDADDEESKWIQDTRWIECANDVRCSQHATAEAERLKHQELLRTLVSEVNQLDLPGNALDLLIDGLGGTKEVSELSGRSVRQVRVGTSWTAQRRRNNADSNNQERAAFQAGEKKFAVITGAASAGISLHAEKSCANQRPRVMLITELTWAADDTMQQFGRIHRSNQTSCPAYELTVSSLGGESRFVGSITARLQSLGVGGVCFFVLFLIFLQHSVSHTSLLLSPLSALRSPLSALHSPFNHRH
jgi:hypothetical protein